MVAYFVGVVHAPMTAFVIVTEMTGNHAMVVPLMAPAFIDYANLRWICREAFIMRCRVDSWIQRWNERAPPHYTASASFASPRCSAGLS
jgi:chloride channel protein, CIC family